MATYEQVIEKADLRATREKCTSSWCQLGKLDSQVIRFKVPSDYDVPDGHSFTVTAERFQKGTTKPKAHIITIAGGPGGDGRNYEDVIEDWADIFESKIAFYGIDHRGLKNSGSFLKDGEDWTDASIRVDSIAKNGPFPVHDLTMTHAALDIGALARVIRESPDWDPSARIVLYGFSYGSYLGHHVVQMLPNTFDAMVVGGLPRMPGSTSKSSLLGLTENCAMDDFCRSKIGSNVKQEMDKAVKNIIDPNYNGCVRMLHEAFAIKPRGSNENRVVHLSMILRDLIMGGGSANSLLGQVTLPFLKATSDCTDESEYKEKILTPVSKVAYPFLDLGGVGSGSKSDTWVNAVVWLDIIDNDYSKKRPDIPVGHLDLHYAYLILDIYQHRWNVLEHLIKDMKYSQAAPAVTEKTAMYMAQSRMDLNTVFEPGYDLYESIKAPKKRWALFNHRAHDGYFGICMLKWISEAALNIPAENMEECMAQENEKRKLDWRFTNNKTLAEFWNFVTPGSTGPPQVISNIPTYRKDDSPVSRSKISPPPPKGTVFRKISKSTGGFLWPMIKIIFLLGILAALAFAAWFVYKKFFTKKEYLE